MNVARRDLLKEITLPEEIMIRRGECLKSPRIPGGIPHRKHFCVNFSMHNQLYSIQILNVINFLFKTVL